MSLFDGDPKLVVSALKPADNGPGAMLHAYNPTEVERDVSVNGRRTRLDETPMIGTASLRPFEIAAWRLVMQKTAKRRR
jgi:hypothetical protein